MGCAIRLGAHVRITVGYTQNMIGFGWTNGVYLKMWQLLH